MRRLLTFAVVGLLAQVIDGSLGMAYGATSASLLVAAGYSPALVSASVHLAEVGTTLASGVSHWRFGNVDWTAVRRLALPGGIGAFAGATLLSSVDGDAIVPWTASILFGLGLVVLARFALGVGASRRRRPLTRARGAGIGLVGGTIDAIGGGGWGPVATPALLTTTDLEPRRVVGSVDTAEFVVSVAASVGFLIGIGRAGIDTTVVVALLLGGVCAAPFAAWLVRRMPTTVLGIGVGGILLLTNARTLIRAFDLDGGPVYAAVLVLLVSVVVAGRRRSAVTPEPDAGSVGEPRLGVEQ